jgi:FkbM family methyltransferase
MPGPVQRSGHPKRSKIGMILHFFRILIFRLFEDLKKGDCRHGRSNKPHKLIMSKLLLKIISKVLLKVSRALQQYRGRPLADGIEKITVAFHRNLDNVNFDINTNGELRVLKILSAQRPKCVFDVGANIGEWSAKFSAMNPECEIHAFEPIPDTFERLVHNVSHLKNIKTNNIGLSEQNEKIIFNIGTESDTATAYKIEGMKFHDEYYERTVTCSVKKAVDYATEMNIGYIDFVKIDVEGMDLRVIKGFENKLSDVQAIQFEYGIFNISSHDLLSDFCLHLQKNDYKIGKIFPRHVKFFDYHFDMENFHGANYIAVKKDQKELIAKLCN